MRRKKKETKTVLIDIRRKYVGKCVEYAEQKTYIFPLKLRFVEVVCVHRRKILRGISRDVFSKIKISLNYTQVSSCIHFHRWNVAQSFNCIYRIAKAKKKKTKIVLKGLRQKVYLCTYLHRYSNWMQRVCWDAGRYGKFRHAERNMIILTSIIICQ